MTLICRVTRHVFMSLKFFWGGQIKVKYVQIIFNKCSLNDAESIKGRNILKENDFLIFLRCLT